MTLVVLRALGLGDLLTAVPALRALADAFPRHRRLLACPAPLTALALHTGAVDEVVPVGPLEPLPGVAHRADVAVNLHGCGPESHRVLLAAHPRELVAFGNADVPWAGPGFDEAEHEAARWCRLLTAHGIDADPERLDVAPPRVPLPAHARGAAIVHPGAGSPARRWPPGRFATVAGALDRMGLRVLITGSADEAPLARRVAGLAGLSPDAVWAGRTDVLELAALVAGAACVICGDTGVAHLATALGTPSVLLFGPTPPELWGPPSDRRRHRVLWAGICGDAHGRETDPGLLAIEPDDVLGAVVEATEASLASTGPMFSAA